MFKALARMKPAPRFIVIALIVGGVVVAGKFGLAMLPQKAEAPQVAAPAPVTVPAEGSQPTSPPSTATPPVAEAQPAPAPAPAPTLTPAAPTDAGLANVLGAGKK